MHRSFQTVELDLIIEIRILLLVCLCCCLMGDNSEESKRKNRTGMSGMKNLSLDKYRCSRDLLQRFKAVKKEVVEDEEEEDEALELSLGLSLGGRFGVDKNSKLLRSSSVAACLPIVRDDDALVAPAKVFPALARTSSLPVETEEEWRKRKELQTSRRMEAKRRRSEKKRNSRVDTPPTTTTTGGGGGGSGSGSFEEEKREIEMNWRERLELLAAKRFAASVSPPFGSSLGRAIWKGKASSYGGGSQGSMESQGGSSSSVSQLENKALQGSSSGGDLSPASMQSLQEGSNQDAGSSGTATKTKESTSPPCKRNNGGKEIGKNSMEDMPCVFTKGDGPNGKRVDGILYKYGKGEDVRIMCVCHGDFLSPADFVKHAGGSDRDITHPLKHIVINPNPPSFR